MYFRYIFYYKTVKSIVVYKKMLLICKLAICVCICNKIRYMYLCMKSHFHTKRSDIKQKYMYLLKEFLFISNYCNHLCKHVFIFILINDIIVFNKNAFNKNRYICLFQILLLKTNSTVIVCTISIVVGNFYI